MKYFAYDENNRKIEFLSEEKDGILKLTLPLAEFKGTKKLRLLPEISKATAGDEGFYILPRNISMRGEIRVDFKEREDALLTYSKPVMAVYAIVKKDYRALVRFERNYKFSINAELKNGSYSAYLSTEFGGKNDLPYDDIRIEIIPLPENANLGDIARVERELRLERGEIIPLADK